MTDTVKLRCGECGSEGEFPVLSADDADQPQALDRIEHVGAIYTRWVEAHASCLESAASHEANLAAEPTRIEAAMAGPLTVDPLRCATDGCTGEAALVICRGCHNHLEGCPEFALPDEPAHDIHNCTCVDCVAWRTEQARGPCPGCAGEHPIGMAVHFESCPKSGSGQR